MSTASSRQRKIGYGIGILLLLVPVVYLGFPARQTAGGGDRTGGLGVLAQKRQQYSLGEATLGQVDPTSSAMNLVLLGLRGPAASVLHLKAIDYQNKKQWAKLRATVDSITRLQPHYVQIWEFQGLNLAYNVSREWDKVADRFYWVKEGIKFLIKGTNYNEGVPILFHKVGDYVQSKMSVSDETIFFREFFERDPDPRFMTAAGVPGPDDAINPEGKDSTLVSYDWFVKANDKDDNDGLIGVKGMTHVFFRQGPARALLNYAATRSDKGLFEEHIPAWESAYNEWMDGYGKMDFYGMDDKKYRLNSTESELEELAEENGITLSAQRRLWSQNLDMVNFRQWRDIAGMERQVTMLEARRSKFLARLAFNEGRGYDKVGANGEVEVSDAQKLLETAMEQWAKIIKLKPELFYDGDYVDDCVLIVQYYKAVNALNSRPLPEEYPLKQIYDANESRHSDAANTFEKETQSRQLN